MGCPRCGFGARKVIKNTLVCQKCGHIDEVKMDNAKAIELAELDVDRLISVMHQQLNYWQILRIFLIACDNLYIKADAEYWMSQF